MKHFILKELRVNFKWAVLGFLVLCGIFYPFFYGQLIFFESGDTLSVFSVAAACVGFLLGLIQTYPESAPDRWAFAMHRPLSAKQIALSKIIVGITLLTSIWIFIILLRVFDAVLFDKLNYPMYWFRPLPAFIATLIGIPAYFVGLMFLIWKPRWRITRLFFMAPVMILTIVRCEYMVQYGWNYLWAVLLFDLILIALLFVAVLNIFQVTGEQSRTKGISNLMTIFSVSLVTVILLIFGISCLEELLPQQENSERQYVALNIGTDGVIYRVTHQYNQQERIYSVVDMSNLDDPDDQPFHDKIKKRLINANEFRNDAMFAKQITLRRDTRNSAFSARSFRYHHHGLFRYGEMTQFLLGNNFNTFTVSRYEGLIYDYSKTLDKRYQYRLNSVIGKNSDGKSDGSGIESFGDIIMIDQDNATINYIADDGRSRQSTINTEKCLIVCADAIYKLTAKNRTVEKVYTAPAEMPILSVGHFPDEKNPLFIIEHADAIRVLSAKTDALAATHMKRPDNTKPLFLYLPDKELGLIPLTGALDNVTVYGESIMGSLYYLPQKKSFVFSGSDYWKQHFVNVGFDGKVIYDREVTHLELDPHVYDNESSRVVHLFLVVTPPLFSIFYVISMLLAGNSQQLTMVINQQVLPIAIYFVFIIVTVIFGQWYCRRKCMNKQQRRRCFWASLLLGPAGVLAFWMIEEPAHVEQCESCNKKISVRDEVCPACDTSRKPLPEQTKEIIAEELTLTKSDNTPSHRHSEAVPS